MVVDDLEYELLMTGKRALRPSEPTTRAIFKFRVSNNAPISLIMIQVCLSSQRLNSDESYCD